MYAGHQSSPLERSGRGTGSALRRAYPVPGAIPDDMQSLLRKLDAPVSRSVAD